MLYLDESPYSSYDLHRMEMYDIIYDYESRFRDLDDPDDYYRDNFLPCEKVIRKSEWGQFEIHKNDIVDIVRAVGGG